MVQKLLDQEYNVHGLRLIVPPVSGRSKHKSFLQELSFSIQTHSNCKMALIVGFVSISEMMNCIIREKCASENWWNTTCSLTVHCCPQECHFYPWTVIRHPEACPHTVGLQILLHSYWDCCVDNHMLYTEWQFCFLFTNLIIFLFYFYDSYSFYLNFIILYQYNPK